jgi:hypothetical protein
MPHDGGCGGRPHRGHNGDAERPERETNEDALASFASGNACGVEAVEAHRHPGAAFVRTIDSVSARHDTGGTTDTLGRNVRPSKFVLLPFSRRRNASRLSPVHA